MFLSQELYEITYTVKLAWIKTIEGYIRNLQDNFDNHTLFFRIYFVDGKTNLH